MAVATKPAAGAPAKTDTAATPAPAAKPKKEPVKRTPYGGERFPADHADEKQRGQLKVKLTSVPTDFNPKTQLPPTAKDFADRAVFFDWREQVAIASAARFKKLAEQERQLGDSATRAEKKRLLSLTEKVQDIKSSLLAGGMTQAQIDALMASVVAQAPAKS
jgi:uncharacterized protein YdcH (DUF465 family)